MVFDRSIENHTVKWKTDGDRVVRSIGNLNLSLGDNACGREDDDVAAVADHCFIPDLLGRKG